MAKKIDLEEVDPAAASVFKKKLKKLSEYKGSGTQLISLYLPEDVDRSSVMSQLTEEISQSSNIKSPQTRKNVQAALRKIINFLKQIDFKLPKHGLVIFCGNVSETEGKTDIRLLTVNPIKDLKTKLYWCDSEFHLAPLKEMVQPTEIYGLITMDKREATIAVLKGKRYEIVGHFTSAVAGKTRAGGQCCLPETLIQKSDGEIIPIKDSHNPHILSSVDFSSSKITSSPITDKWNTKKIGLRIITKCPRMEINCSDDHSLFVAEDSIKEKTAANLKEGDFLIMPEKIKVNGSEQGINTKQYYNNFKISKKGINFIKSRRKELGMLQRELAEKSKVTQTKISQLELGKRNPRNKTLRRVCKALKIPFEEFIENYAKQNSKLKLPEKITAEFAQLIGYFAGDGHSEGERISFSEQNREVAEYYQKKTEKLFNAETSLRFRENKGYWQVRVYGKPIVNMLKSEFPEISKARTSLVPAKILKSKDNVIAAFIKGLFDAEGYVSGRLGLGMNNKLLVKQLQLMMLRFGILSSVMEYNNKQNPYSNNPRFTLEISEKKSLEIFNNKIGFTFQEKTKKLKKITKGKTDKSNCRQLVASGKHVRKLIENSGYNLELFPKVTNFFRNGREISKQAFQKSIIDCVEDKSLKEKLKQIYETPLIKVKIGKIEKLKGKTNMVDISVKNQNFIANGLVVHNSAHRFEHLREEAAHNFYKKVSEKMNAIFEEYTDKLKGVIIGGPGATKNYFLNTGALDHRLTEKIIAKLDTSYTDESGIRELVQKSEDVLRDTDLMRERSVLNSFFEHIVKDQLAAYGEKDVLETLKQGRADTLLISEDLEWIVIKVDCSSCGKKEVQIIKDPLTFDRSKVKCSCGGPIDILEEIDYADYLIEKAQDKGTKVKIISTETSEGEQFLKGFGGIGAILRF